jgi:hypothetical protein
LTTGLHGSTGALAGRSGALERGDEPLLQRALYGYGEVAGAAAKFKDVNGAAPRADAHAHRQATGKPVVTLIGQAAWVPTCRDTV